MDAGPCSPASCAPQEYCATCGASAGKCVMRPVECHVPPEQIVCGCDGRLYMNLCEVDIRGVGISNDGGCEQPPGTFRCGTELCTHGTQYCQRWYRENMPVGGPPYIHAYACADLAAGCGATPTCACIMTTACGECTVSADGDLTAMCLLPF